MSHPQIVAYSRLISYSYLYWTKTPLVTHSADSLVDNLYDNPHLAIVSHGIEPDPIFCYANLVAQKLWEMNWEEFTRLPSRLSAEPDAREERARLLAQAEKNGVVDNYSGIRITKSGKRFKIKACTLWNVLDIDGHKIGQAACFDQWEWL